MKITLDPSSYYREAGIFKEDQEGRLVELLGIIPHFLNNIPETSDVKEGLTSEYGMGNLYEMVGHTIHMSTMVMSYPNDSDLYPLVKYDRLMEVILQYNYGIVAILPKDGRPSFTTRMD